MSELSPDLILPTITTLAELWKVVRKLWQGLSEEGLYEILDYETTLELLDKQGESAQVRKRQKVRYLQNNVIAYQDQAWGDGQILLNYRCTPGFLADRYNLGHKTYLLISLRDVKRRGDLDEFNIEWEMRNSFQHTSESWETEVTYRMKRLKVEVIFPKSRPPLRVSLVEGQTRRSYLISDAAQRQLPDGRWIVSWETDKPRLYERYIIKWDW
jgi:hypothetical protein